MDTKTNSPSEAATSLIVAFQLGTVETSAPQQVDVLVTAFRKNNMLTTRESRLVGWFAICLGAGVLASSVHGVVFLGAPPPSTSLTRDALHQGLIALFGVEGGHLAYHLIFAFGASLVLWTGLKILRQRAS